MANNESSAPEQRIDAASVHPSPRRHHRRHHRRVRTQQKRLIRKSLLAVFWLAVAVVGLFAVINVTMMISARH